MKLRRTRQAPVRARGCDVLSRFIQGTAAVTHHSRDMHAHRVRPTLALVTALALATPTSLHAEEDAGGITSETMHHLYGGAIFGLSTTLLVEDAGAFHAPSLRYSVPGVVMTAGALLTIDPLLHGAAAPKNYGAETRQHLLLGGMLLAVGSIDLAHEARWLDHWSWGLALPAGMLAASASFFFHAQHGDPAQHELLQTQHRLLGATIAVAAVAKGLSAVPVSDDNSESRWPELRTAWIVAAGLTGVQLLLYSEGSGSSAKQHEHASVSLGVVGRGIGVLGAF